MRINALTKADGGQTVYAVVRDHDGVSSVWLSEEDAEDRCMFASRNGRKHYVVPCLLVAASDFTPNVSEADTPTRGPSDA